MAERLIQEISSSLAIPVGSVEEYAGIKDKTRDFYRRVLIPKKKKKNEYRVIFMPSAEIKQIQHYLSQVYFSKLPVHDAAKAYRKGKNVIDNAIEHAHNNHFLLLDIEHFFDSMDPAFFESILLSKQVFSSSKEAGIAIALCSYKCHFVQGCVSSPIIANAYLYEFDNVMEALSKKLPNGIYTRYSDDIVFSSSERIPDSILQEISSELAKYKLHLNQRKTHFFSNLERVKITGIRIKNSRQLGLSTDFKKALKKESYSFLKKARFGKATQEEKDHLQGKLSYLKMADPSSYNSLCTKYSVDGLLLSEYIKRYKAIKTGKAAGPFVMPRSFYQAVCSNRFYCFVSLYRDDDADKEERMLSLILYNDMDREVVTEIEEGASKNNLFLPLAFFHFEKQDNLSPDKVYVAELNPQLSDDHALVVHEATPCHFFAMNRGIQTCTLAFREPLGEDEIKTAESLLGKWKKLEEYATEI